MPYPPAVVTCCCCSCLWYIAFLSISAVISLSLCRSRIPTQCIVQKNVQKKDPQTLHNICLKLNSKLQGTNQALHPSVAPPFMSKPIMFLGADVTHPPPDAIGAKPSIAAVVGSCDPKAAVYNCEIRLQTGGQVRSFPIDYFLSDFK